MLLSATLTITAQSVQRNTVVIEIATGTWCVWCPGAAKAADQLVDEGKNVAIIENHNGDPYANTYSNGRNSYYAIGGYPTGKFDGALEYGGGAQCPTGNAYASYLPLYNQRNAVPSPITLCFSGTNTGNDYTVNVSVTKLNSYEGNDLRLHLVLTESHIPVDWQSCMTEVNFVNRLMVPDLNGTPVSFASNNTQMFSLNFQKDPTWVAANCELVAFVQDYSNKEIFNAIKSPLNSIPATAFTLNDFTANVTSGCAPLSVDFSTTQNAGVTYSWSFEAGNPPTSTLANPTVSYSATGSYDVILTGTNGLCFDSKVKTDYINVLSAPVAPNTPYGPTGLCENPANQTYNVTAVANTDTYSWELSPPEAGVATPVGTSCSVNWSDTWTGVAQLKVMGANSCGNGNWSVPLNINIDLIPGQCPAPTGQTTLCANAPITQYITTGIVPSTYYIWELTPESAGTFYQGAQEVDIDWADGFTGTASLRVKANNGSCEGTFSTPLQITVNSLPASYSVSGGGTYCGPSGTGLPVELSNSQVNTNYTLYKDGIATSVVLGGTGNAISFGNQLAAGTYTAKAVNQATCAADMTGTASIAVDPQAPEQPSDPAGPAIIITSETPTSEFVTQSTWASSYSWDLTPAASGTITGTGANSLITWNQAYIGTSVIKVQGMNTCGGSVYSNEVTTSVNIGVGITENILNSTFTLSPNPADNFVTLNSSKEFTGSISIVNSLGKVVLYQADTRIQKSTKLDISHLNSGVYNVLITSDKLQKTVKLVIE